MTVLIFLRVCPAWGSMSDVIDVIESEDDIDALPSYQPFHKIEPIIIRGTGQFTM